MSTRNIGTYDNMDALWEAYPAGGLAGDTVTVNGTEYHWSTATNSWVTGTPAQESSPQSNTTADTTVAYQLDDLMKSVRIVLDNNMASDTLSALGDIDTLSLDEIIRSHLIEAVRSVEMNAPLSLLGGGTTFFGETITWYQQEGKGSGFVHLPDDFLRLIIFQMSDWQRPVFEAVSPQDPRYNMLRSRYAGVSGCPEKPSAVLVNMPTGMVLEFHSCVGGAGTFVRQASYIPYPKVENDAIGIPYQLKEAVIYFCAYLTATTTQDAELAEKLLGICNTILSNNPV